MEISINIPEYEVQVIRTYLRKNQKRFLEKKLLENFLKNKF